MNVDNLQQCNNSIKRNTLNTCAYSEKICSTECQFLYCHHYITAITWCYVKSFKTAFIMIAIDILFNSVLSVSTSRSFSAALRDYCTIY